MAKTKTTKKSVAKPEAKYRHVILVVDRSGSMHPVRDEATTAIRSFIDDLKIAPGRTTFSLWQFDTEHDLVHNFAELEDGAGYTLVPRGMTALNDAIGLSINDQVRKLADLPAKKRPERVQFVVMTDGQENSSREYTVEDVRRLIKTHQDDGWDIVYLSADPTAQTQAHGYGVNTNTSAIYDTTRSGQTMSATAAGLNTSYVTGQSFAVAGFDEGTRSKMSSRTHLFDTDDDNDTE